MLASDGNATYVMYLYREIVWVRRSNNIGFDSGDGIRAFNLFDFVDGGLRDLPNITNVGIPGAFYFRVDGVSIEVPPEPATPVATTGICRLHSLM